MTTRAVDGGYRDVLLLPHALRIFAAALIGRLSFATVSLAMLLAVQRSTGSFGVAGLAVGLFGLSNVLVAPARARLVDRLGQPVALPRLAAGYSLLLCLLAAMTLTTSVPGWTLTGLAGVTGLFPPPLGAAMRGLWALLTSDSATRNRAYSLDAVAEELLFVAGPLLVGLAAAVAHPAYALIGSAAVALAGTNAMTRAPVTVGPGAPPNPGERRADQPLRQPGFRPLLVALLGVGVVLGTVEVTAPAFAQEQGNDTATGLLLAALSAGSAVGGLLYGKQVWRQSLAVRLLALGFALCLASAALIVAQHLLALAALLIVLGLFLGPALITGYLLADQLSPASARTEASSWINTAANAGAAGSAALSGFLIDRVGTGVAFAGGAVVTAVCFVITGSRVTSMVGAEMDGVRSSEAANTPTPIE